MVMKERMLYTVREAAAILCVTPHTVRSYIAQRKLRAVQRGDGYYLIHADDLRVFLGLEPDETLVAVSVYDGMVPPVRSLEANQPPGGVPPTPES